MGSRSRRLCAPGRRLGCPQELDTALDATFVHHPDAEILRSLPGLSDRHEGHAGAKQEQPSVKRPQIDGRQAFCQ